MEHSKLLHELNPKKNLKHYLTQRTCLCVYLCFIFRNLTQQIKVIQMKVFLVVRFPSVATSLVIRQNQLQWKWWGPMHFYLKMN